MNLKDLYHPIFTSIRPGNSTVALASLYFPYAPPPARLAAALLLLPLLTIQPAFGWGADGHMLINRLAGAALPADVPAFLRTPAALDALAYYGPEPDRWRSPAEPELNAAQAPDTSSTSNTPT